MSNYLFKHPVTPLSNVDGRYANVDASHYPGGFGSNETSLQYGLPALRDNVSAANASVMKGGTTKCGCGMKGGKKKTELAVPSGIWFNT